jgi:hypothetical protein
VTNGVTDPSGNAVPATWTFDFYVLAGDANRDRKVDFNDLTVLAQNYNATGMTFAQGNFDYEPAGTVGFNDLALLAQRYNTTLPPALASPAGAPLAPVPRLIPLVPKRNARKPSASLFA